MFYDNSPSRDFRKILLICFGGIGDVILFFPVIKLLKEIYPIAEITLTVEPRCKTIAEKNLNISKTITFDVKNNPKSQDYISFIKELRNEKFDLAISMGSSAMVPMLLFLSGAKYRVGYSTNKLKFLYTKSVQLNKDQYAGKMYFDLLKGIGIDTEVLSPIPEINIPENDLKWSKEWFENKNLDKTREKVVIIHPGASTISKQKNIIKTWEVSKWASLIDLLTEKNLKVVLVGGPDDKEDVDFIAKNIKPSNNFINAYGETKNFDQLGALITQSSLLVCIDSAPLNLSVGVKTPCVAIFGPTNEKKILPQDDRFTVVRVDLECTPCLWDKRQTTCEELTCLRSLDVSTVFKKVIAKIEK